MKAFRILAVADQSAISAMPNRCIVAETPFGYVNLLVEPYKLWHNSVTDERSVYIGQTTRMESAGIDGLCATIHGKSVAEYERHLQSPDYMKVWEDEA